VLAGIAELFSELDSYHRYEDAIYAWALHARAHNLEYQAEYRAHPQRRAKAVERMRQWRKTNPERARAHSRIYTNASRARLKERDPDGLRAKDRETKRRYRARHPEHMREVWRRNQAAVRARKKAAAQVVQVALAA